MPSSQFLALHFKAKCAIRMTSCMVTVTVTVMVTVYLFFMVHCFCCQIFSAGSRLRGSTCLVTESAWQVGLLRAEQLIVSGVFEIIVWNQSDDQ